MQGPLLSTKPHAQAADQYRGHTTLVGTSTSSAQQSIITSSQTPLTTPTPTPVAPTPTTVAISSTALTVTIRSVSTDHAEMSAPSLAPDCVPIRSESSELSRSSRCTGRQASFCAVAAVGMLALVTSCGSTGKGPDLAGTSFTELAHMVHASVIAPGPVDEVVSTSELVAQATLVGVKAGRDIGGVAATAVYEFRVTRVLSGELPDARGNAVYVEVARSPIVTGAMLDKAAPKGAKALLMLMRLPDPDRCGPTVPPTRNKGAGLPAGTTLMVPTYPTPGVGLELADGSEFSLAGEGNYGNALVGLEEVPRNIDAHAAALANRISSRGLHSRGKDDPSPLVPPCTAQTSAPSTSVPFAVP